MSLTSLCHHSVTSINKILGIVKTLLLSKLLLCTIKTQEPDTFRKLIVQTRTQVNLISEGYLYYVFWVPNTLKIKDGVSDWQLFPKGVAQTRNPTELQMCEAPLEIILQRNTCVLLFASKKHVNWLCKWHLTFPNAHICIYSVLFCICKYLHLLYYT